MEEQNVFRSDGNLQRLPAAHHLHAAPPPYPPQQQHAPMQSWVTGSQPAPNPSPNFINSYTQSPFKMTARRASRDFRTYRQMMAPRTQISSTPLGGHSIHPGDSQQHVQNNYGNPKTTFSSWDRVNMQGEGHVPVSHPASSVYLQAVSTLGQSPSAYSRISSIVSSPHLAQEVTSAVLPSSSLEESPQMQQVFKSPTVPDSQLMELQTVTPSRIDHSPRSICGQTNKAYLTPQRNVQSAMVQPPQPLFRSPPNPLRVRTVDGAECSPIVTKTASGRISITYPLSMLANTIFPGTPAADSPTKINIPIQGSFTQFLNFSDTMNQQMPVTPVGLATQQNVTSPDVVEIKICEGQSGHSQPATADEAREEEDAGMEADEDDEDRENVESITKALNIECDVYKETKKAGKKRNKMPKEFRGLMGEANLCYARGDHEDAIKMCMEIIRSAPYCSDPFETLAMIYDERGERDKSIQYSLLAAHLQPADVDQWVRLAESCEEVGFLTQAIHCYMKASKVNPNDYRLRWAAAVLQQQLGKYRQALETFKSVVLLLPDTEVMQCLALARDIARACHANNETGLAVEVMEEVMAKHSDHVKYEDINVVCELVLASKQYKKFFEVMVKNCNADVQYETGPDEEPRVSHIKFPNHIPVDLQCKVILACIHLGCRHLVQSNFEDICSMDPSDIGDLQFDIAEALIEMHEEEQALTVLEILVNSPDYSLAAVWLKKAECHRALSQYTDEINCLREVTKLAQGHIQTYLSQSKVLRQLKRFKEAEEVIEEAETYEMEGKEPMLLSHEKFHVYSEGAEYSDERHEKLCKAGDEGLLMLAAKLESALELAKVVLIKRGNQTRNKLRGEVKLASRVGRNFRKYEDKKSLTAKGRLTIMDDNGWWDVFVKTVEILVDTERYLDATLLVHVAQYYPFWYGIVEKRTTMEKTALDTCMISGNYSLAYSFIRPWLFQNPKVNQLWNLFNQITARSQDLRHHRFCLRLLVKEPENIALAILTGHNSLATGTYKHSLGEYMRAHKKVPTEPMFMMLIGVIYTHIATQKFTSHKNSLVAHAITFLNLYKQHRKCDQETCYNIGRSMHQLGLLQFAVLWYKKALETPPPEVDMGEDLIDLKHEIAYNLAIIYKKSGSLSLANKVLEEYCVV